MLSLVWLVFNVHLDDVLLLGSVRMLNIHCYLVVFLAGIRLFKVDVDVVLGVGHGLLDIEIDLMFLNFTCRLLYIHVHIMILLFRILFNFDLEDLLG